MNRRNFAKLALAALASPLAFVAKLAAGTPREQEIYIHAKLGRYKSHEIFRVQTPRFNGWATQLDFSHMAVEWRPVVPNYDNLLINYEHGSELYYVEGHDEPFNKKVLAYNSKDLFKCPITFNGRQSLVFVVNLVIKQFVLAQTYKNDYRSTLQSIGYQVGFVVQKLESMA